MNLPKPTDDPVIAEQRVSDALESVVSNPSERAFVLVAVQMAIKANVLQARRDVMDEIGSRYGRVEAVTH